MGTTYIYVLRCPLSNKVRYVGKTNNPKERYKNHLNRLHNKGTHKANWIVHLRNKGLRPIFEIIEEVDIKNWKSKEKYYISHYIDEGCDLVNHTEGGDGLSYGNQTSFKKGHKSPTMGTGTKKKCIICGKEFPCPPSRLSIYQCCSKECRRVHVKDNPNSGAFIRGLTPWNKGKQLPKNKSNSKPIIQINITSDEIVNKFPSAAEAERQTGINQDSITNNIRGKSRSAGGFKWKRDN